MMSIVDSAGAPARPLRVSRWMTVLFRALVIVTTVLILVQPLLAGLFVTGNVTLLSAHRTNATVIQVLTILMSIVGLLIWRPGRGSTRYLWHSLALFVLVGAQAGFGFTRVLWLHFPLGVALFAYCVFVVRLAMEPIVRTPKPERVSAAEEPAR
jgi:hypothetical protein